MKNVLVIAYYFPPLGGAGVQRPLKFVKYFKKFGWKPVVLSVADKNYIHDSSLFCDISPSTEIIRVKYFNLIKILYGFRRIKLEFFGKFILKYFAPIDIHILWAIAGFKRIKKYLKNNHIDVVYVTGAPFSSFLIAYWIKKKFNIPYLLDYRDDWVENPFFEMPFCRKIFEKFLEKKIVSQSSAAITVSAPIKEIITRRNPEINMKVITNGYDGQEIKPILKKNKKLKMIYAGSFYKKRSPLMFFHALSELINEQKINPNNILVDIYGQSMDENIENMIEQFKLDKTVRFKGRLPHSVLLKKFNDYDVFLMIVGVYKNVEGVFSGKIFEYIAFGKPIFAIVPDGVIKKLLIKTRLGIIAHPEKIKEIKKQILFVYDNFYKNKLVVNPNRGVIEKYDRKKLTNKLVDIFEKII